MTSTLVRLAQKFFGRTHPAAPVGAGTAEFQTLAAERTEPARVAARLEESAETTKLLVQFEDDARASVDALLHAFAPDGRSNDARRLVESFQDSVAEVRLPSESALASLRTCLHPSTSEDTLLQLITRDPFFADSVIRSANATFYKSSAGPCASLRGAVQRIGAVGVHNVILKQSLDDIALKVDPACPDVVRRAWSHMRRTARIARAIAPAFDISPESAYTVGLLHDVGKLVVFDHVASLRRQLRRDLLIPASILSAVLRVLHEDLGGLVALHWELGADVGRGVATHHRSPIPQSGLRLSEVAFVAERWDVLAQREDEFDLESIWIEGGLTGSKSVLGSILAGADRSPCLAEVGADRPAGEREAIAAA